MVNLIEYQDIDQEVKITFTDGTYVIGVISSVDDEEESELGEMGISVFTRDGAYLGLAQSEIAGIEILK